MVLPFIIAGGLAAAAAYTYFGENLVSSKEAKTDDSFRKDKEGH
jgi:phage shock protein E